jgi:hypothetical protein
VASNVTASVSESVVSWLWEVIPTYIDVWCDAPGAHVTVTSALYIPLNTAAAVGVVDDLGLAVVRP